MNLLLLLICLVTIAKISAFVGYRPTLRLNVVNYPRFRPRSFYSLNFFDRFNIFKKKKTVIEADISIPIKNDFRKETKTLILGAGISGLTCANTLLSQGEKDFLIVEASNGPGGRVRTDEVDGYLLDRGFQVFIEGYPEVEKLLNYSALDLRQFIPGAMVRYNDKFYVVSDPFRRPQDLLPSLISPIGTIFDKIKVGLFSLQSQFTSLDDIWGHEEKSTEAFLSENLGLSEVMISRFFAPFYQGIFLSPLNKQSSRMFEFVFKMFAASSASLPAKGMQAIGQQLADRIPKENIIYNYKATVLGSGEVLCESTSSTAGDPLRVACRQVVLAIDPLAAETLVRESLQPLQPDAEPGPGTGRTGEPVLSLEAPLGRGSVCLYFGFQGAAPVPGAVLLLNGENQIRQEKDLNNGDDAAAVINNICFPSEVVPEYSPEGNSLASVTVVGQYSGMSDAVLEERVRSQLVNWFPEASTKQWKLLKIYRIPYAQPAQVPPYSPPTSLLDYSSTKLGKDIYICGDFRGTATLNGAVESGIRAANQLLSDQ